MAKHLGPSNPEKGVDPPRAAKGAGARRITPRNNPKRSSKSISNASPIPTA